MTPGVRQRVSASRAYQPKNEQLFERNTVFRIGIPYSTRDNRPMQLIVDGAYLEGSYLNTLNYNDVQAIEVLRNINYTAIYGGRGNSGVMLVTTRRGNEDDDEPQPIYGRGITTTYPKGYYKARDFIHRGMIIQKPIKNWPICARRSIGIRTLIQVLMARLTLIILTQAVRAITA